MDGRLGRAGCGPGGQVHGSGRRRGRKGHSSTTHRGRPEDPGAETGRRARARTEAGTERGREASREAPRTAGPHGRGGRAGRQEGGAAHSPLCSHTSSSSDVLSGAPEPPPADTVEPDKRPPPPPRDLPDRRRSDRRTQRPEQGRARGSVGPRGLRRSEAGARGSAPPTGRLRSGPPRTHSWKGRAVGVESSWGCARRSQGGRRSLLSSGHEPGRAAGAANASGTSHAARLRGRRPPCLSPQTPPPRPQPRVRACAPQPAPAWVSLLSPLHLQQEPESIRCPLTSGRSRRLVFLFGLVLHVKTISPLT